MSNVMGRVAETIADPNPRLFLVGIVAFYALGAAAVLLQYLG